MNYEAFRALKMKALKEKDQDSNRVITSILSALTYEKKELGRDLTDDECAKIVAKLLKQVKEAYDMAASRPDQQEKLQAEMDVLSQFLPAQMSEAEVVQYVEKFLADSGLEAVPANKGRAMKELMQALGGQVDGKMLSGVVNRLLTPSS